jgi:hypothetical protein
METPMPIDPNEDGRSSMSIVFSLLGLGLLGVGVIGSLMLGGAYFFLAVAIFMVAVLAFMKKMQGE